MTTNKLILTPPAPLTYWPGQGGIWCGLKFMPSGKVGHLIAAIGKHELIGQQWGAPRKKIAGADSYHDGRANTEAMAGAGSNLAQHMLALEIDGHTDWALPSQADGHLLATNAKHLMQPTGYWLSTQYSAGDAWVQYFGSGGQDVDDKDDEFRAVPVRCIQITD